MLITKKNVMIPSRPKSSRKGDSGRVLVIGGSQQYVGAVVLAGLSALRSGVDWVTIAAPEKVGWAAHCLSPDLVVKKFSGTHFSLRHVAGVVQEAKGYSAVLIGNGIGRKSDGFVREVVKKLVAMKKPLVIDADALKVVRLQDVSGTILTPHAKEFEILLKNSRLTQASYKKKLGDNVIVITGPVDKIITRGKVWENKTGNPGMTKAGTGDVLVGLCVSFLAQGLSKEKAAINAAYFTGKVGDILAKKHKGYTYLASDLVKELKRYTN